MRSLCVCVLLAPLVISGQPPFPQWTGPWLDPLLPLGGQPLAANVTNM
jgi:hypothetical protein